MFGGPTTEKHATKQRDKGSQKSHDIDGANVGFTLTKLAPFSLRCQDREESALELGILPFLAYFVAPLLCGMLCGTHEARRAVLVMESFSSELGSRDLQLEIAKVISYTNSLTTVLRNGAVALFPFVVHRHGDGQDGAQAHEKAAGTAECSEQFWSLRPAIVRHCS